MNKKLKRIPHPDGKDQNVGCLISKNYAKEMETGVLSSELPQAKKALHISMANSYWTSTRKRVMEKFTKKVENPYGSDATLTLPDIRVHGTITRRCVDPLFLTMCSTKEWKIGSELKTRIEAPVGWTIIGFDFDGQEMQIASIYSDKLDGGFVGCSPLGFTVLSGSKNRGTDIHTNFAKMMCPEDYEGIIYDEELGILEEV